MKKKILITITILLFYGCGFTPVYKNENFSNLSIASVEFSGDRIVNNILNTKLFKYRNSNSKSNYELKINSSYSKIILAKDTSGNATNYELRVFVNVKTNKKNKNNNEKNIELNYTEKNNIKNENNNISQKNYEKQIISNLASTISRKIAFDLSNLNDN